MVAPSGTGELISVNVGGTLFRTTRTTLAGRDSMLAAMFGGTMAPSTVVDEAGHPLVSLGVGMGQLLKEGRP